MAHLEKITLKHIRKYSDEVVIPIEKGATIFLAPNGTGKTAIFEAIELALTGKVHRLANKSLDSLIRDNFASASVRLDFDAEIFCQTILTKNQVPTLSGNYGNLFGGIEKENIPFLLRLTHLLDQQSNGWFVHSDPNAAGTLLDNLSIGRDAIKANLVMSGAKRAATQLREGFERNRNEHLESLQNWQLLIKKRADNNNVLENPLYPLNEILKDLNTISESLKDDKSTSIELPSLVSFASQLIKTNAINIENVNSQKGRLQNIQIIIKPYSEALSRLEKLKTEKGTHISFSRSLEKVLEDQQNLLLVELKKFTDLQEQLDKLEVSKRQFEQLEKAREEKIRIDQAKIILDKEIEAQIQIVGLAEINLEEARRLFNINDSLLKRKQQLENNKNIQNYKGVLLAQWQQHNDRLVHLNMSKAAQLTRQKEKVTTFREAEGVLRANELALKEAQARFDNLNSASDSIKQAVAVIASSFPEDKSDCPVCLAHYDPTELRSRITQAVSAIDPELENAKSSLEQARRDIETSIKLINQLNVEKDTLLSEIKAVNDEIDHINTILNNEIFKEFSGITSLEEASKYYDQENKKLDEAVLSMASEEKTIPTIYTSDQLLNLESSLSQQKLKLDNLRNQHNDLLVRLSNANETEKALGSITITNSDQLQTSIIALGIELEKLKVVIETLRNKKVEQETQNSDAKKHTNNLDIQQSQIEYEINSIESQWVANGLGGEPNDELLKHELNNISKIIRERSEMKAKLEKLEIDLAKWKTHEEYFQIDREIKGLTNDQSDDDFDKQLNDNLIKANKELELILERISTLNTFSSNLSTEINSIHEKIKSINPYWNQLLRKIVIDPRFSNTILESYTYYNKPHADVKIGLHGDKVLASDIASEAQITDLQLTFLLSMAYKYQWSSWKGLLLDDPTQHHDLVHASGVFDLLRDYIVDHDFQIILATHDAVQAKFLYRKLENDGIPSKIWNLESSETGVIAKEF